MMKRLFLISALVVCLMCCEQKPTTTFEKYFTDQTLRIDYFHEGDAKTETVEVDELYSYEGWAGSLVTLVDSLNYGAYYHKVYDQASGKLIYSKGFDSYFKEYQTSTPAINGEVKRFHESAIIPKPLKSVVFALDKRDKDGNLNEVYRTTIDPSERKIAEKDAEVNVYASLDNGDPHIKADILIVGEGYAAADNQKFQNDLKRFTEVFFQAEPCKSYKDRFNIRGVLKPSEDSGIDEPRAGIDKNTAVSATFNSMGSERYLLTEDNKALRDIAGHAPYDALYIMVNHSRYGGGGIYNFYCTYTSDNIFSEYLMVHEFGHSFFGLADEYYTSSSAYNDFYPQGYEPAEPNITALLDPENVKWKHLLSEGIELPTSWNKAFYDSTSLKWQAERRMLNDSIAALKKAQAPAEAIAAAEKLYDEKVTAEDARVQDFLENADFSKKVGAFEGAGYASVGIYRSSPNCIMFTRTDYFCPVCQEAMIDVIESYAK
ncbi:MAG: M64 family metallopeptidase [Reichenbachiella sp.]|uniref:M64 family metallopeptidase n=1 Tax=Reichenbachiella sp. TaxID=2184521 RepID=UPI002967763D|nr:M64 family metallopeptidase [Reichenbachiella sp.]MDW3208451.1 M64 family metallopeptidase [Reichenbachiella sp.]